MPFRSGREQAHGYGNQEVQTQGEETGAQAE
jgi:hypothetical protein